ncbi:MAG: hypothetical protein ACUVRD_02540 [Bacteroidia bacterium]
MFVIRVGIVLASFQVRISVAQPIDSIAGLCGCETLVPFEKEHLLAICWDRIGAHQDTSVKARLYSFEGTQSNPFVRDLTPPGFRKPLLGGAYRRPYLWVSTYTTPGKSAVYRLRWHEGTFTQIHRVASNAFFSVNSLTAVDSLTIYATNDIIHRWRVWRGLMLFLRLAKGNIIHCQADSCRIVAKRLPYPNGITYLPAQSLLMVATTLRKQVWIYQVMPNGSLIRRRKIRLKGYPDNLSAVSDSCVWALTHKRLWKLARSTFSAGVSSRWQIEEICLPSCQVRLLFRNPSSKYGSASMAVPMGTYVYVGSINQSNLLRLDRTLLK